MRAAALSDHHSSRSWRLRRVARRAAAATLLLAAGLAAVPTSPAAPATTVSPAVLVVNTDTDSVTPVQSDGTPFADPIPVGNEPTAVAITPDGQRAYVTNSGDGTVTPIDLTTNPPVALAAVAVGVKPLAVAVTPDGSTALVVDNGLGRVVPIATKDDTVQAPIPVGASPQAIAVSPDGKTAYVTVAPNLLAVNLLTRQPGTPVPVGADPRGVAVTPDGSTVLVVNHGSDSITPVFNGQAGSPIPVGPDPLNVAISADGTRALVTNNGSTTVRYLPLRVGAPPAQDLDLGAGRRPVGVTIAPDATSAYVTSTDGSLTTITLGTTGTSVGVSRSGFSGGNGLAALPDQPADADLAVGSACGAADGSTSLTVPDGTQVWFDASASTSTVTPLRYFWNFGDGTTAETVDPCTSHTYAYPGSYKPLVVAINGTGTSYFPLYTGQTMSRNGSLTAVAYADVTVEAGVIENETILYVANGAANTIVPVAVRPDGSAPEVGVAFPTGTLPAFPAVEPGGRAVVVPNVVNDTVSVTAVCGPSGSPTFVTGNTVAVGSRPMSVAISPVPLSSTATPDETSLTYAVFVTSSAGSDVRELRLKVTSAPTCAASLAVAPGGVIPMSGSPYGIALTPDGTIAFVSVPQAGVVVPVVLLTKTALTPIPVGAEPRRLNITPDGRFLYVANYGSNSVSRIPVLAPTQGVMRADQRIDVGANPGDLAIASVPNAGNATLPDSAYLFVTNSGEHSVTSFPLDNPTDRRTTQLGSAPTSVAVTPDGTHAYVTSYFAGTLTAIRVSDAVKGAAVTGLAGPIGVVASPDQPADATLNVDLVAGSAATQCPIVPPGRDSECVAPGATVEFRAGGVQGTTPIARYLWNFGDNSPLLTTTASVVRHTYEFPGTFSPLVVAIDEAGTGYFPVFTGQTMSRNGSPLAVAYAAVNVVTDPLPSNRPVLYVANQSDNSISPIGLLATGPRLGNSFPTARLPVFPDVDPTGRAVVSPDAGDQRISLTQVCDDNGKLQFTQGNSLPAGRSPWAVAFAPTATGSMRAVYVSDSAGEEVRQFLVDISSTCGATLTEPVPGGVVIPTGPGPRGIAMTTRCPQFRAECKGTAYVAVSGLNAVVPIDLATNTPGSPIPVGTNPYGVGIAPDHAGGFVYAVNYGPDGDQRADTVTPIDVERNRPLAAIQVGDRPLGIAFATTLEYGGVVRAYVTNSGDHTVTSFVVGRPEIPTQTIPLTAYGSPRGVVVAGDVVYVTAGDAVVTIPVGAASPSGVIRGLWTPVGIVRAAALST